jgi:hypothetical protein
LSRDEQPSVGFSVHIAVEKARFVVGIDKFLGPDIIKTNERYHGTIVRRDDDEAYSQKYYLIVPG